MAWGIKGPPGMRLGKGWSWSENRPIMNGILKWKEYVKGIGKYVGSF